MFIQVRTHSPTRQLISPARQSPGATKWRRRRRLRVCKFLCWMAGWLKPEKLRLYELVDPPSVLTSGAVITVDEARPDPLGAAILESSSSNNFTVLRNKKQESPKSLLSVIRVLRQINRDRQSTVSTPPSPLRFALPEGNIFFYMLKKKSATPLKRLRHRSEH